MIYLKKNIRNYIRKITSSIDGVFLYNRKVILDIKETNLTYICLFDKMISLDRKIGDIYV